MRPGLPNSLVMDYQAVLDFQPHRTPLQCEGRMVPGLAEPPVTERHSVMRHIAVYQQESLAFGGVPNLTYRTVQSPLSPNISGVADQLQDQWIMRIEQLGEERIQETPVGTREQQPPGFIPEVKRRNSSTESEGDPLRSSLSYLPESPHLLSGTGPGSDRGKSAWRKIRLYLPDSALCPSPSVEEDSVFEEAESPEPPVAEVKEPPLEAVAPQGKGEQERWRFSASELISKLQLTQRRSNFTARLGKSLSTKITLRERGASSSQEGKSGRRERRCNSAGGATLLHPGMESDSSWLRNKETEGAGRPPTEEKQPPSEERLNRSNGERAQKRQSYCERRQSRFLLNSILYQEYSDVAINREIQRQKREDAPGEDEEVSSSPRSNLSPSSSFRSQRSSRGSTFSLWQDIPDVRGSGLLNTLTLQERKLQEAKFELVTSEASYVHSLSIAADHFLNSPELNDCLGAQERQWLFSKLPEVKEISERFLMDLEERLEGDILHFDVCDIVLRHCPELRRVYLPYVTNQAYQEQTYQRLLQENQRFRGILSKLEEDQVCQRLPLTSFLILPFQRIMRLKMLVENILKHTAPGSQNEDTASKAFTELKKIFPLISQSRWLVKHGELVELDMQIPNSAGSKFKLCPKAVYLHLFNDCLLLSRRKELGRFAVFAHAQMSDLKVTDLSWKLQEVPGEVFHVQLCHEQRPKHQILLRAQSESEKQRWISAMCLSSAQSDLEILTDSEDFPQVQCIKGYTAQEHDELTLEKADILRLAAKTSDGKRLAWREWGCKMGGATRAHREWHYTMAAPASGCYGSHVIPPHITLMYLFWFWGAGWMEVIRLSDGERGWVPATHVEEITNKNARLRNLRENKRIKHATSKLERDPP
uniref:Rho guanine nucleotide exchange factor 19 n=1 Tax=Xenopus tropicalis TaxID=8364 RepID=A0A803JS13_XENTR